MSIGGWTLDIKEMSWVENTGKEVDFIVKALGLKGNERILDLACGFGRHSLELARRGYKVTGVDYTAAYIDDAVLNAKKENLDVDFILAHVLSLSYLEEFDVVLNMADGAIGYFDTEEDNLKLFDIISDALKPGGKHVMGVCSADFYKKHCPWRCWQAGKKALSLSDFLWDNATSRMFYRSHVFKFGEVLECFNDQFPEDKNDTGIRLYSIKELKDIFLKRKMKILNVFGTYDITVPVSADHHHMTVVCSQKDKLL